MDEFGCSTCGTYMGCKCPVGPRKTKEETKQELICWAKRDVEHHKRMLVTAEKFLALLLDEKANPPR